MPKLSLTDKNIEFIKQNRLTMSGTDMAKLFGISKGIVTRYMGKSGLSVPKELQNKFRGLGNVGKTTSTPEVDNILKDQYLNIPSKTIANMIGKSDTFVRTRLRQLNLVIPKEIIEQRKIDSQIKQGNIPFNKDKKQVEYMSLEAIKGSSKTRFKKGQKAINELDDGDITIRQSSRNRKGSKPHKYIRLSKGVWKELQKYNWEQKFGEIPKGFVLACKNGDTLNCETSNWELMPMAENAKRNAGHVNLPDTYVAALLSHKDKDLKSELLKYPELIEIKRKTIVLTRKLKNENNGK